MCHHLITVFSEDAQHHYSLSLIEVTSVCALKAHTPVWSGRCGRGGCGEGGLACLALVGPIST